MNFKGYFLVVVKRTCVHCPWDPVLPKIFVTLASFLAVSSMITTES